MPDLEFGATTMPCHASDQPTYKAANFAPAKKNMQKLKSIRVLTCEFKTAKNLK